MTTPNAGPAADAGRRAPYAAPPDPCCPAGAEPERPPTPDAGAARDALYASEAVERSVVRDLSAGGREASLLLEGIRCGACASLIEQRLRALPGVDAVEVNFATHRARVAWQPARVRLVDLLRTVRALGYGAQPFDPARLEDALAGERRERIRRLAVAGLLAVQVMMLAIALYAGDLEGMASSWRDLLRWASLILCVPVVGWCALPFLRGALRDIRNRRPGMDVPVSLGLALAFAGSVQATIAGGAHVYFDSVATFVFLLLLARHLEFVARARHARAAEALVTPAPKLAIRLTCCGEQEAVPAAEIEPGDRVLVRPGDTVPADGRVASGSSTVDEALLTGESRPVPKAPGARVIAGSTNQASPLEVLVEQTGGDTVLARMLALVERARAEKPPAAVLADRVAARFVSAVLVLAAGVALYWWWVDPARWLPATVAVLVVTCPCALSLATPAAFTAAVGALARRGLVVARGHALETLARIDRFAFDKTGTLTLGHFAVVGVHVIGDLPEARALRIAAALERQSEHPLGRAIEALAPGPGPTATEVAATPGGGIEGVVDGRRYVLGTARFVGARTGLDLPDAPAGADASTVVLADEARAIAAFDLRDETRPGARELLDTLRALGLRTALLSGDRAPAAGAVARALAIDEWEGDLDPREKLERIRALQSRGEVVAMAGDGINDAPVLAAADVSVAMGGGPEAARASADLILLGDSLPDLAAAVRIARRCRSVVRQNLGWAVLYNAVALPAAAAGLVTPWMAALGMSISSLVVVANGLRAGRGA